MLACAHPAPTPAVSYSAAFVKDTQLIVFPFEGESISLSLPFKVGRFMYSPDGKALYSDSTFAREEGPVILETFIKPAGIRRVLGSTGFSPVYSLAASSGGNEIVISGKYHTGDLADCGIFDLNVTTGHVKPVIIQDNPDCDYVPAWHDVSVSPNGKRAVAREGRNNEIMLIDLDSGAYRAIGEGFLARWSPDGRSIAILDSLRSELLLVDANDSSKRRDLAKYEGPTLEWSPDSRYLLIWESEAVCSPYVGYFGTFEALDVQSGQRIPIKSSRCKVNLMTGGWVSNQVIK